MLTRPTGKPRDWRSPGEFPDLLWCCERFRFELVEGSAPSEAEKEATHGVKAGYVGAPVTPGVMAQRGK
jgi:hypothetical protein